MTGSTTPRRYSARVAQLLRKRGLLVDFCERKIPRPGSPFPVSKDLFGLFDLLVVGEGHITGVQVTGASTFGKHLAKYKEGPEAEAARRWFACGGRFHVVMGRKPGTWYEFQFIELGLNTAGEIGVVRKSGWAKAAQSALAEAGGDYAEM